MNRRTLLFALPVVATGGMTVQQRCAMSEEMAATFRRWHRAHVAAQECADDGDDVVNAACAQVRELEGELCALPVRQPGDVLAKLVALTMDGASFDDAGGPWCDRVLAEARDVVHGHA